MINASSLNTRVSKTVCFFSSRSVQSSDVFFPEFCVNGERWQFLDSFKYLGDIIFNSSIDDADIQREITNVIIRTNKL